MNMVKKLSNHLIQDLYQRIESKKETIKGSFWGTLPNALALFAGLITGNLILKKPQDWSFIIWFVLSFSIFTMTLAYSIRRIKIWYTVQRHFRVKDLSL